MKINSIRDWITRGLAVGVVAFWGFNAKAAHELMYATSVSDGNLLSFYSDTPGTIESSIAITGLQNGEVVRGIDWQNGTLYGLGSQNQLYTIDLATGAATAVGTPISPILNGSSFGTDVGPAGFQITSDLGQSLTIALATGIATVRPDLSYAVGDTFFGLAPTITATAFDSVGLNWIAADSQRNTLATFDPATGLLNTLGPSGIDFSRVNGLDISEFSSIAYMASPAASSDPQANLYIINKTTGVLTLQGLIGLPGDNILVGGVTIVPEPGTLAMLASGGLLLVLLRRKSLRSLR